LACCGGLIGMWLMTAGCRTVSFPPADFGESGWAVRERAALWCPGRGNQELAGELLLASHPEQGSLLQFSKQGLPLVTARTGPGGWEIRSSLRRGKAAGRGKPPDQVPWFLLMRAGDGWNGVRDGEWRMTMGLEGRWRLENGRTGEWMEIYPDDADVGADVGRTLGKAGGAGGETVERR